MLKNKSRSSTQTNDLSEKQKEALEQCLLKIIEKKETKKDVIQAVFALEKTNYSEMESLLNNISKIRKEPLDKLVEKLLFDANNPTVFYQALSIGKLNAANLIFDLFAILSDGFLSNGGLALDCFTDSHNPSPIFQCAIDKKASILIRKMLKNPRLDIEGMFDRFFDQTAKVYRNLMKYAVEEKDQEIFGLLISRIDEKNLAPKRKSAKNNLFISESNAEELRSSLFDTTTLKSLRNFKSYLEKNSSSDQSLIVINNAIDEKQKTKPDLIIEQIEKFRDKLATESSQSDQLKESRNQLPKLEKLLSAIINFFESKDVQKNSITSALMEEISQKLKEPGKTTDERCENIKRCLEDARDKLESSKLPLNNLLSFFTKSNSTNLLATQLDDIIAASDEKACDLSLVPTTSQLS